MKICQKSLGEHSFELFAPNTRSFQKINFALRYWFPFRGSAVHFNQLTQKHWS